MNHLEEIQTLIEKLTSQERAHLAAWLRGARNESGYSVSEAPPAPYGALSEPQGMSVDEYLASEEKSKTRHEYVAGQIFAMTGASLRHTAITRNLTVAFGNHLRGNPCQVFMIDTKVRLQFDQQEIFYYPDVVVACGRLEMKQHFLREPKLIIEVLSPSTEAIDRREKSLHYRTIATLDEYALVAQSEQKIIIYRRKEKWEPRVVSSPEDSVEFRSIALSLPLARVYEGVIA